MLFHAKTDNIDSNEQLKPSELAVRQKYTTGAAEKHDCYASARQQRHSSSGKYIGIAEEHDT